MTEAETIPNGVAEENTEPAITTAKSKQPDATNPAIEVHKPEETPQVNGVAEEEQENQKDDDARLREDVTNQQSENCAETVAVAETEKEEPHKSAPVIKNLVETDHKAPDPVRPSFMSQTKRKVPSSLPFSLQTMTTGEMTRSSLSPLTPRKYRLPDMPNRAKPCDTLVSSQKMLLENIRYMRREVDKTDRELKRLRCDWLYDGLDDDEENESPRKHCNGIDDEDDISTPTTRRRQRRAHHDSCCDDSPPLTPKHLHTRIEKSPSTRGRHFRFPGHSPSPRPSPQPSPRPFSTRNLGGASPARSRSFKKHDVSPSPSRDRQARNLDFGSPARDRSVRSLKGSPGKPKASGRFADSPTRSKPNRSFENSPARSKPSRSFDDSPKRSKPVRNFDDSATRSKSYRDFNDSPVRSTPTRSYDNSPIRSKPIRSYDDSPVRYRPMRSYDDLPMGLTQFEGMSSYKIRPYTSYEDSVRQRSRPISSLTSSYYSTPRLWSYYAIEESPLTKYRGVSSMTNLATALSSSSYNDYLPIRSQTYRPTTYSPPPIRSRFVKGKLYK